MDKPVVLVTGIGSEILGLVEFIVNAGYPVAVENPIVLDYLLEESKDMEWKENIVAEPFVIKPVERRCTSVLIGRDPFKPNSGPRKKRGKGNRWHR